MYIYPTKLTLKRDNKSRLPAILLNRDELKDYNAKGYKYLGRQNISVTDLSGHMLDQKTDNPEDLKGNEENIRFRD